MSFQVIPSKIPFKDWQHGYAFAGNSQTKLSIEIKGGEFSLLSLLLANIEDCKRVVGARAGRVRGCTILSRFSCKYSFNFSFPSENFPCSKPNALRPIPKQPPFHYHQRAEMERSPKQSSLKKVQFGQFSGNSLQKERGIFPRTLLKFSINRAILNLRVFSLASMRILTIHWQGWREGTRYPIHTQITCGSSFLSSGNSQQRLKQAQDSTQTTPKRTPNNIR